MGSLWLPGVCGGPGFGDWADGEECECSGEAVGLYEVLLILVYDLEVEGDEEPWGIERGNLLTSLFCSWGLSD